MAKRKIVKINEKKCNGCGQCVPNCHEGALQIIDKKARLISDLFCDGLGACIGHCPTGAITIEEREAKPYNERKVMEENIVPKGINTIRAHIEHLKEHGATEYYNQAIAYLREKKIKVPILKKEEKIEISEDSSECNSAKSSGHGCSCPGSSMQDFSCEENNDADESGKRSSQLKQWPVQLHLVSPNAPYFLGKDVLLAADCTAFAVGDFHKDYLKGKTLAIACPKLDSEMEIYVDKLVAMIDESKIKSLTVMTMEVPCCYGLLQMAKEAVSRAKRKIKIKSMVISLKGAKIKEENC